MSRDRGSLASVSGCPACDGVSRCRTAIGGTEVLDRLDALEDLVKNVLVPSLQRIEQRLGTDPEALDDDPDGIAVDRGDILDDWGGESSGTPWADCFNSMGNGLDEALESLANTQDDA